ncbi:dihydrolipoamide dehydrogenase [Peptoclostridium litorale DSM 5388]|uniref:Dihydrolipoyl dehydrogenase n=1 Tax=Peptoclostridium litorale DSM 5388 TaxID=1121324 RepID=A0A069RI82_PEPLI|nr:dihydrolipoyl dehydrogenase [Peptoclostridium litorale]KDR93957.1 dihydrolipoyl dehydrogenase LpdA [Peptoclostridium litorale DSM 5388]KDR95384.1 dihydrolipoyl dehydrogenase LpdA [Peptoclostridium litorale DSM 5388]SIN89303.1 dihydrolipoamide dehydrogenase [Peptoclostridium litorale DSM 5388]
MEKYNIAVIGGGPGGYVAAIKAAQLGAKTVLIEKEKLGGICLNWGCIPTKTLLKSAKVYQYIMNSEIFGVDIEDKGCVHINWDNMQDRKERVVSQLTGGVKSLLEKNGVDVIMGEATVASKNEISVNGQLIKAENIIIATGSSPMIPPIEGISEAMENGHVVDSTGLLEVENVPKELVVIGAGVIGIEFACLFSTLGCRVSVLQRSNEILGNIDYDVRKSMEKKLLNMGIEIIYGANIQKIDGDTVYIEVSGEARQIRAEKILVSTGRVPNFKGLESLELEKTKRAIVTDESLRTSIENIYAIGDVNGKFLLAHVASAEGIVAAENIMGKDSKISYDNIPGCIYAFPEIATVGLTEKKALEKGHDVKISKFPMSANGKALAEGESSGFIKIVADEKYGKILGVHIIGVHATDMISEALATIQLEGTAHDLAKAIHPHPTMSEIVMEAAHGIVDRAIHL